MKNRRRRKEDKEGDGVGEDSKGQEKDKKIGPYFGREEQNLKILRQEFRNGCEAGRDRRKVRVCSCPLLI